MDELSQQACKIANKIALSMLYGETIGQRGQAGKMMKEAFDSSCELLELIDPVELRSWFEQFQRVFSKTRQNLIDDPIAWSKFLGSQCDLLHQVGLHQKTIASVGDELARWDRAEVSFDDFANGLDRLSSLVSENSGLLETAIERQAGTESKSVRRTALFTNAICGLTIVLVVIDQAINSGDPRNKDRAALASFGASLTMSSVESLFQACHLNWA